MSQAQRAVIALLACFVVWLAWQDSASRQPSVLPLSEQPRQQNASSAADKKNPPEQLNWNNWTHDPIAVLTGLLTLFNGLLFVSTIGLWLATRKSAGISERALTELEAPFLAIKINSPGIEIRPDAITFGVLQCSIVNYGRTPASILEFFADTPLLNMDDGKFAAPVESQKTRGNMMPYGVIAPPNGGETKNFPFIVILRGDFRETPPPPPLKTIAFFIGFVKYSDVLKNCFVLGLLLRF